MNVLIVENDTEAAEHLNTLLKKSGKSIVIQDKLESIKQTVTYFSSGKTTDLVFLNIELADGKCFEIFNQVKVDVPIIFMNANDQYALQAFKHFGIDYLLKPIQQEDVEKALEKWRRLAPNQTSLINEQFIQMKDRLGKENQKPKQRILIKSGNKLQYKHAEEVAYFYADGKEVYIYTRTENKKFLIDYTLEQLETQLDKEKFFRISRKAIVNADVISEIKGIISTRLEVKLNQPCEHELTISRDRSSSFKAWLDR
jgi:DNA-binding LytR/AlgR family response regulator